MKTPPTMRGCTAPIDVAPVGLLALFKERVRCGAEVVRETPVGNFCVAHLEEIRENYDKSPLKILRDCAGKGGNPFE